MSEKSMKTLERHLPTEEALLHVGSQLAPLCYPPLVIFLYGQLGAGKTTFARGFLRGLGFEGKVKSPSYNLIESYEFADKSIFHFDFYRIQHVQELEFLGLQDYWQPSAIFLIEWPDIAKHLLPAVDVICELEMAGEGRTITLRAETEKGEKILNSMSALSP